MTLAVPLSLITLAVMLALAAWLVRGSRRATPNPLPALAHRPLPDCELGQKLQMASAAGSAGAGTPRGVAGTARQAEGGSGGGTSEKRNKPSAPSRRKFLRISLGLGWLGVLGGFGSASLAYLWPNLQGGFGAVLEVAPVDEILNTIDSEQKPYEFSPGQTYLVRYDKSMDPEGRYAELTNGAPVMALFWTCVHLGCKVPWCASSEWWECPCHGSKYNRWGEYRDGPAPRGLDRFNVRVENGTVMVDTSKIVTGPPRGVNVLGQEPQGPHCA